MVGSRDGWIQRLWGSRGMIILGDGGHCGMGYVTPASVVKLVSKLCKLF